MITTCSITLQADQVRYLFRGCDQVLHGGMYPRHRGRPQAWLHSSVRDIHLAMLDRDHMADYDNSIVISSRTIS
jgi:hypothetical protein